MQHITTLPMRAQADQLARLLVGLDGTGIKVSLPNVRVFKVTKALFA
jgi:hypothetical protein